MAEEVLVKILSIAVAFLILGCASNSGVRPIGVDTFMVSRQAGTGMAGMGTLKADAFDEANEFCLKASKQLSVVHTSESQPPFVFGNFPRAEIEFMCLNAGDPELKRPKLVREPTAVTEIRNR